MRGLDLTPNRGQTSSEKSAADRIVTAEKFVGRKLRRTTMPDRDRDIQLGKLAFN